MKTFTISELAEQAGVTPRTIRFYTTEGLLPPPDTRGRYAQYGEGHLHRLRQIQRMKELFLPLYAIRERLDAATAEELPDSSEDSDLGHSMPAFSPPPARKRADSALNYIRRLADRKTPEVKESAATNAYQVPPAPRATLGREHWERITIAPGLELHARTPRAPETQKLIDRLIEIARAEPHPTKEGP